MFWHSQTPPVSPDSIDRRLRGFTQNRRYRTATSSNVDAVQAVETQRTVQVTGPHIIALMYFIRVLTRQLRIRFAFRLIAAGAPMGQPFATDYSADGPQARQRRNSQGFKFPTDRLRTTKQSLVVSDVMALPRVFDVMT